MPLPDLLLLDMECIRIGKTQLVLCVERVPMGFWRKDQRLIGGEELKKFGGDLADQMGQKLVQSQSGMAVLY